jgi:hypothetical protein
VLRRGPLHDLERHLRLHTTQTPTPVKALVLDHDEP